jgi:hypothetical protein
VSDPSLENQVIEYLILEGAAEVAALDTETGEPLFRFTPQLKEIDPELYNNIQTYFNTNIMLLWQKGFVILDPTDSNSNVYLTDKAYDKKSVSQLDKHEQGTLKSIIASMEKLQ